MSDNTHDESAEPLGATDTSVDEDATVSLGNHTTNAIASIGEVRAETAEESVEAHLSATARPVSEGGSAQLVVSRDSVIVPHTEDEANALKTARQSLAEAITNDAHGDIITWEAKVRQLDTYNLTMDIVKAVTRSVEVDEDMVATFNGGTIAQMTDFCVRHDGKVRSCITRHGKIASWVRNRESIQPMVAAAVNARRKRVQDCTVTQEVVKTLTSHEDTKVMDSLDIVNWSSDDDGLKVGYKVEYETEGFDKVLKNLAPRLDGTPALLSFGAIA